MTDSFNIFENKGFKGKRMFGRVYHPHLFKQNIQYMMNNFNTNSHDVFITTYPKCGTTFMQQICILLMKYGALNPELYCSDKKWWLLPWIEDSSIQDNNQYINKFSDGNNLRIWKTHSPWETFPVKKLHKDTKLIMYVRIHFIKQQES